MTGITFDIGSPRSVVTSVTVDNRLPYAVVQTILLQHGHCTFVIICFGPFITLFINLTMCIRALFSKSATTLRLVEQAFWRMPLFTERIGASPFEATLAGPSRHSTTGTLSSGTSDSRRITLILLHERIRRRIRLCQFSCNFSTLIGIVTGTANVSFRTLPVGFHCQQSPRILCPRYFLWILDHGVLLKISILCSQNSYFVYLARYFFLSLSSICDNQVLFSSDETPGHTIPIRS